MSEYKTKVHEFPPVYDENSRILILGSFPSVKSREIQFYYGHPQNRFWKVFAAVFESPLPETIEEKRDFLHENRIALWDVIEQCDITGSSDASIKNVIPTDLNIILNAAQIEQIYCNGATSYKLFNKYQAKSTGRTALRLPSTSPANAQWSLERLIEEWKIIRECST